MSELVSSGGSTLAKAAVQKLLKAVVTPSFRRKLLREMINGAPEPHPRIRLIDRLYLWRLLAAQDTPRLLLDPSAWAKRTFADDVEKAIDVHPPTGERRKLAEDLARVARERVFAVLEQAEATAALAGHLQDVAVRGAGRIHAADVSAVRQRIRSVNDRERRRCLSSGRPSTQLEPPPLRSVISDYLSQQPWHERCRRQLDVVLATVGQFPSLRDEAAMLRDVDIDATYDTVWHQLSDARDAGVFDRILMTLHRAFAEQEEALLHASSEERRAAERATAQLAATARRPAFDFCLLLVGSWGSGRTRTLAEVFSLAETAGDLAISLDLDAREPSVVDQLVQTVAQVLDIPLAGLAALDRVLSDDLEIRCLVVVDDVDQSRQRDSRVLDELQALVEQSTRFHSLRWVMASDELYVDQVAGGRRRSEFWQRYGYRQPSPPNEQLPSVGGWIDVDAANTTSRLGVQILQRHVPPSLSQELQAIAWREAPLSYELHLVSNPLQAWLRLDIENSAPQPVPERFLAVHHHDHLEAFWKLRVGDLQLWLDSLDAARQVLGTVTTAFAMARTTRVPQSQVAAIAARSALPLDRDTLLRGIEQLRTAGLLRIVLDESDGELELPSPHIEARLEGVWGYRVALRLLTDSSFPVEDPEAAFTMLRAFLADPRRDDRFAEAVVQFALQLAADATIRPGLGPEFARRLWRAWYTDRSLPREPLFLAAVQTPGPVQNTLVGLLHHQPVHNPQPRELFTLMRYVGLATSDSFATHERLEVLEPLYPAIGSAGLGRYLLYVASRLLDPPIACPSDKLPRLLLSLSGSEAAGVAEEVAARAFRAAAQVCEGDEELLHRKIIAYLHRVPHARRSTTARQPDVEGNAPGALDWGFMDHLLQVYCGRVVAARGLDAFEYLAGQGWYEPRKVPSGVALQMRVHANLAFGEWYRRMPPWSHERDAYLRLIDDLITGEQGQVEKEEHRLEIAFRLIRHTVVTRRQPAVLVDNIFRARLDALYENPIARQNIRLLDEMHRVNCRFGANKEQPSF